MRGNEKIHLEDKQCLTSLSLGVVNVDWIIRGEPSVISLNLRGG